MHKLEQVVIGNIQTQIRFQQKRLTDWGKRHFPEGRKVRFMTGNMTTPADAVVLCCHSVHSSYLELVVTNLKTGKKRSISASDLVWEE
ncbi:hypothetical protein [Halodesulfovibrio aestuarii]|uniref:Phage protein n=1 Tax=Halodesulfovibrio aestuarii TaxID=126333 RepID=A0ABV4JXE1_9BACT